VFGVDLHRLVFLFYKARNVAGIRPRNTDVSDGKKDHFGRGIAAAESTGSVLHAAAQAFGDGVGAVSLDGCKDCVGVFAHRSDELLHGFQTAPHEGSRPVLEDPLG
jgi:hypothetical protein